MSVGGVFHLEFGGSDLTGDVVVPVTGGWQTWATVSTTATLPAGTQLMRFVPTVEGFNINSFEFLAPTGVSEQLVAKPALHPCHPNPFNPVTNIAFTVPAGTESATLRVYDVSGRLVATLVDEAMPAGAHSVVWDGTNRGGEQLASGVYFARLEVGNDMAVRKMTLLK